MKYIVFYIIFVLSLIVSQGVKAVTLYEVEEYPDNSFVINEEYYDAKRFCSDIEDGDPVIFVEGAPGGSCTTAKLYNIRTKLFCEVWCE